MIQGKETKKQNAENAEHLKMKTKSIYFRLESLKLDDPVDLEKWKEQRRKNFPTKENVTKKV